MNSLEDRIIKRMLKKIRITCAEILDQKEIGNDEQAKLLQKYKEGLKDACLIVVEERYREE